MFNVVDKYSSVVKVILTLIIISFALWGIAGYLGMSSSDGAVAKVGSNKIFLSDVNQVMQNNPQVKTKPEALSSLVSRQLLLNLIEDNNLEVTDGQLQATIMQYPEFQTNGVFSMAKYKDFLHSHFINVNSFEDKIKKQILLNQLFTVFKDSYFNSSNYTTKFATLLSKERSFATYTIDHKAYLDQINIAPESIAQYYKQHVADYTIPERVKLQYIELTPDTVGAQIHITPEEIQQYITTHEDSLSNKQVDASHILFAVPQNDSVADTNKIEAQAKKVLAQVQANPGAFAQLAKKYSADSGSAAKGGELGYFGRGIMVKAFESKVFSMQVGQIALVKTQFGFHIIKLNNIKTNSLAQMELAATTALKNERSTGLLQKYLDKLKDLTYTQSKSLDAASKALNIPIQSTKSWVLKSQESGPNEFANPVIQKAIFTNDVIVNGNNSEVVELGNNHYAVYRVTGHEAARIESSTEVSSMIETALKLKISAQMAATQGQNDIQELQQSKLKLDFTREQKVNLLQPNPSIGDYRVVVDMFALDLKPNTPSYMGAKASNGDFIVYKVTNETVNDKLKTQNETSLSQMQDRDAMVEFNAYLNNLSNNYKITYHLDKLGNSEQGNTQGDE